MRAALGAGLAGAVTTTALHELVRRVVPSAPRVDLLGMQALAKLWKAPAGEAPAGGRLYALTLALDIVSNAAYFALCARGGRQGARRLGVLLGLGGGFGAVLLPGPLGLSTATTSRTPVTRLLTVALYAAGGLVAGALYGRLGGGVAEDE